nr:acyltransferase family protein [Streptomyces zhaozhouensis]
MSRPAPSREREAVPQEPQTGVPHAPRPPAQTREGRAPADGRDAFLDNAKYLLIVLVAVGHAWEPLEESQTLRALYLFVYTFHMPAFILICGYLSRSFTGSPRQLRRLVSGVVVPYVVFETAYSLFERRFGEDPNHPISLLDPWYLTWFLAALFVWRLTAPLWRRLRHPLPLALLVAALATTSPAIGQDLDLQRTLQFLPCFVLGLCLRREHLEWVRRREVRLLSVPVVAAAALTAYWAAPRVETDWFYRRASAQELGEPWWNGPVMSLALFGCAMLLTAAFLAWVPARRTWFTVLGAGTICGYLLHGFLLTGAEYGGFFETYAWPHDPAGTVLLSLVTALAVTLMCSPPVRRLLRPVTEPDLRWAFRSERPDETAPAPGPRPEAGTEPAGRARNASRERETSRG